MLRLVFSMIGQPPILSKVILLPSKVPEHVTGSRHSGFCWGCRFFFAAPGCQWEVERLAGCQSLRELSMLTVASEISETFKFSEQWYHEGGGGKWASELKPKESPVTSVSSVQSCSGPCVGQYS